MRRLLRTLLVLFILFNIVVANHAWKFTHFYAQGDPAVTAQSDFWSTFRFLVVGNRIGRKLIDQKPAGDFKTHRLTTSDGLILEAWELPPDPALTDSAPMPEMGILLMFHGHGSAKSALLNEAKAFNRMGYRVLITDFRAHGNSEGEQSLVGLKEAADVKAAYDWAAQKGAQNIVLWGSSMGAATITRAMSDYDLKPAKIILEMPFASMHHAVKGKLRIMGLPPEPLAPFLSFWGGALNGAWAFGYKPYEHAKKITCPVLLQWGRLDPRVTEEETKLVLDHLGSREKQLVIYDSAAHESLYKVEPEKWLATVGGFLK